MNKATILACALVSLLVAGGSATAASLITSSDIKNGTIKSEDIKDGSVKSSDIKNGAIKNEDIKKTAITMDRFSKSTQNKINKVGAPGPAGATGPQGPQGLKGDTGAKGKDAQTVVSALTGPFTATNPSVSLTPDGVEFGPYADGGTSGGSIAYSGLNGQPLSAVKNLVYYARYVSTGDTGGVGVPYLRIFTEGDDHDAIFSPNTQPPDADVAEGPFHEWVATSGVWRYDDDPGAGPSVSFSDLIEDHGDEKISGIFITTGFSAGADLAALLRWMEINGTTYAFRG